MVARLTVDDVPTKFLFEHTYPMSALLGLMTHYSWQALSCDTKECPKNKSRVQLKNKVAKRKRENFEKGVSLKMVI